MENSKGPKTVGGIIATVIGALLLWTVLGYGACKGIECARHGSKASVGGSSDDDRHDDLWRRSQGSDRTNWVPGSVGR